LTQQRKIVDTYFSYISLICFIAVLNDSKVLHFIRKNTVDHLDALFTWTCQTHDTVHSNVVHNSLRTYIRNVNLHCCFYSSIKQQMTLRKKSPDTSLQNHHRERCCGHNPEFIMKLHEKSCTQKPTTDRSSKDELNPLLTTVADVW